MQFHSRFQFADFESRSQYGSSVFPEGETRISNIDFETYKRLYSTLFPKSNSESHLKSNDYQSSADNLSKDDILNRIDLNLLNENPEDERRKMYHFKQLLELPLASLEMEPTLLKAEIQKNDTELSKLLYNEFEMDSTNNKFFKKSKKISTEEKDGQTNNLTNSLQNRESKNDTIFIDIYNLYENMEDSVKAIKNELEESEKKIPDIQKKSQNLLNVANNMNKSRGLARKLTEQQDLIIQLIEIPKRIRQYLLSGRYQEAIDIYRNTAEFCQDFLNQKEIYLSDLDTETQRDSDVSFENHNRSKQYQPIQKTLKEHNNNPPNSKESKSFLIVKALVENILKKLKNEFYGLILRMFSELSNSTYTYRKSIIHNYSTTPTLQPSHPFGIKSPSRSNISLTEYSPRFTPDSPVLLGNQEGRSKITKINAPKSSQRLSITLEVISILRQTNCFSEEEIRMIYLQTQSKSWENSLISLGLGNILDIPLSTTLDYTFDSGQNKSNAHSSSISEISSPKENSASSNRLFVSGLTSTNKLSNSPVSKYRGRVNSTPGASKPGINASTIGQSLENYIEAFSEWILDLKYQYEIIFLNSSDNSLQKTNNIHNSDSNHCNNTCSLFNSLVAYSCSTVVKTFKSNVTFVANDEKAILSLVDCCGWVGKRLSSSGLDFLRPAIMPILCEMTLSAIIGNACSSINNANETIGKFSEELKNFDMLNTKNIQKSQTPTKGMGVELKRIQSKPPVNRIVSTNRSKLCLPEKIKSAIHEIILYNKSRKGYKKATDLTFKVDDSASENPSSEHEYAEAELKGVKSWNEILQMHRISGVDILQYPSIASVYHAFRKATLSLNSFLLSDAFASSTSDYLGGDNQDNSSYVPSKTSILEAFALCFECELMRNAQEWVSFYESLCQDSLDSTENLNDGIDTNKDINSPKANSKATKEIVSECCAVYLFGLVRYVLDFFEETMLSLSLESITTDNKFTIGSKKGLLDGKSGSASSPHTFFDFEDILLMLSPAIYSGDFYELGDN
ncbi:hypothetical protein BB559_000096 [Furculomyces boomerangus]|uniref:Conserved oligomeric Golgi complex subunit 8 n=1 Tax=Furculomyces boomerangus TaxID=61424 RepID=A0A2T9Z699_9FUNG|nr:hypothetical protein BB559_000096 [Furculomyces boomerangus]